ncbi:MAG TPA: mechanosensitive ion channel family protein [Acidobacteriaceae bacterium]|nr:mechanosensitive ion channel family protein [Acidobacteriaceae bacterium]
MFLFAAPAQAVPYVDGYSSFRDIVLDWHHDLLVFVHKDLPKLIFILIFWAIVLRIVLFFVGRMRRIADRHATTAHQRASELRTVAAVLRATAYGVVGFIVILHVLSILGISTTSLLGAAGLVSVGVGLGAQSLFKDVINGIFILIENQFNVGDTVTLASLTGTVENLSLRLTTLRDANGSLYFIPNSQIATVSNLSRDYAVGTLNLTVDATADPDKVLRVLRETALAVRNDPRFKDSAVADPDVPGVDAISGRVVTYPVTIRVRISRKDALMRELRRRILQAFEQNGIPLGTDPANMLLMKHSGPSSADPTAPPAQQPLTGT